jgi:DNA repair exonuclease SbcCD nuclease subunit
MYQKWMKLMSNTSKPARRLLHTSDVHLGAFDSSGSDQETRDKHHSYFNRVMDIAIDQKVDFAVIAGDFFDNARVYEETLQFASDQITRLDAPVIITPGNHDHVGPGSVYDRFDFKNETPNLSMVVKLSIWKHWMFKFGVEVTQSNYLIFNHLLIHHRRVMHLGKLE